VIFHGFSFPAKSVCAVTVQELKTLQAFSGTGLFVTNSDKYS